MSAERLVGVFARATDFLVEPNCLTTTGLWLSAGPVQRLPRTSPPAELGAAVRVALKESRRGVPHPTDWKKFVPPVLEVAGVRSWAALQRSAAKCDIEAGPDGLKVVPSRNGGTRGDDRGYHSLGDLAVKIPDSATDEDLGA